MATAPAQVERVGSDSVGHTAQRARGLARRHGWFLIILLPLAVVGVVFAYPVFEIFKGSFTEFVLPGDHGLANYSWFFGDAAQKTILVRTFTTSIFVTAITLAIGYPYAYLMTIVRPRWRLVLLALVLLPFWTSLIVRTYAWIILMQDNGPVLNFLGDLGIHTQLLYTTTGVTIGMTQLMLPFMVLPLYSALAVIDRNLLLAGESLGASPRRAFARIYLPLSVPGIIAGCSVVFILSLGFYFTPALLGSPRQSLISQQIVIQIQKLLEFGRAGAMALILLVITLIILGICTLAARRWTRTLGGTGRTVSAVPPGDKKPRVLSAFASLVAVLLVAPTLVVIPMSFTNQANFTFPPPGLSTRWYHNFFTDPEWYQAAILSLKVAGVVVVLATTLGTLAALALTRGSGWWRTPARALLIAPIIVPGVVAAIGIYYVFLKWHLTGHFIGFVLAHTILAIPLVIIAVTASLASFDEGLERAAASLGANKFATFRSVTMPLILPGVLTGALFAFLTSFDEAIISLFLSVPGSRTLPVQMFQSVTNSVDPTIAASSTMLIVVSTSLLFIAGIVASRRRLKHA
jgi:putative spermidine/putrescine transport system permease protein